MVKVGDKAPDFKGKALVEGKEKVISLADFKGKKVALYFYPKDLTPGCTIQAENLQENKDQIKKAGITVIGVSTDSYESHCKFAEKKKLEFALISDEDKKIVNAYGVWGEKSFMGKKYMGTARKTFLIDGTGKIKAIIEKPTVGEHAREIIEAFK